MGIPLPLEKDAQKTCLDWLRAIGAFPIRINSGAMKIADRYVRFNSEPGCSDVLVCLPPDGRLLALELKKPGRDRTSPKLKAEQKAFRVKVVKAGGIACVVTSLDELKADLREEGYKL